MEQGPLKIINQHENINIGQDACLLCVLSQLICPTVSECRLSHSRTSRILSQKETEEVGLKLRASLLALDSRISPPRDRYFMTGTSDSGTSALSPMKEITLCFGTTVTRLGSHVTSSTTLATNA